MKLRYIPYFISVRTTGPAETVGQVGHLPYHFLVVRTENGMCYDFYPRYNSELAFADTSIT